MRVLWTARRSKKSTLKEINPEYSLEGLMLILKLEYFHHLMQRADSSEKTLMLGKTEGRRRRDRQRMRWLDGIRWPKYWSFSFSISPSNEYSGLITFRMDWLDLLAVQGTLKSLLQLHGSKASVLQCSAFFTVQLSHPYMTTGKTVAFTRHTFVGKVMSLLFNMLSRLVINFLPRSKRLLISWLQSPSAVVLEPPKIKFDTVSPSVCHEVMGLDAVILVF